MEPSKSNSEDVLDMPEKVMEEGPKDNVWLSRISIVGLLAGATMKLTHTPYYAYVLGIGWFALLLQTAIRIRRNLKSKPWQAGQDFGRFLILSSLCFIFLGLGKFPYLLWLGGGIYAITYFRAVIKSFKKEK